MKKTAFLTLCLLPLFLTPALARTSATLEEGIRQYQQENYEEAIEILKEVRRREPASSHAAFFLGMAYKQTIDYSMASACLRDAVNLSPPIKEALVELIDTLYQVGNLEEAKKWLALAEKEAVSPARASFLKGLILARENSNQEAVKAFERAKGLDPSLAQSAEFQIGMCYIRDRKFDKAKSSLQTAILRDPFSDLAAFARQYRDMVEERLYLERPLRLTLGLFAGYDTNIVSKPIEEAFAGDITDEKGAVLSSSVRVDYVPKLEGPWFLNAQYAAISTVNSKHTHSHNSLANSFSLSPGYNFGPFSLNLTASYTNVLLRTDPDLAPAPDSDPGYKRYLDYTTAGPTLRFFLNQNNMLEFFAGYERKEYYNQKITSRDADRDSVGFREYLSWVWMFKEDSFLNLRYDFATEHADGRQWTNINHRLTANASFPILPAETAKRFGPLALQLAAGAFFQDFRYEFDFGIARETRRDKVYTGSAGLAWKFRKYASLIAQYTRTQNNSNVPIYEYNRDLYLAGLELRF